jgi:hypothetical protein
VLDFRFKDVVIKGTAQARSLLFLELYSPFYVYAFGPGPCAVFLFVDFKTDINLNRKLNVE